MIFSYIITILHKEEYFNICTSAYMNDIRNAPVFLQVLMKTFETNSKIQDILIFALVQYE